MAASSVVRAVLPLQMQIDISPPANVGPGVCAAAYLADFRRAVDVTGVRVKGQTVLDTGQSSLHWSTVRVPDCPSAVDGEGRTFSTIWHTD